MADKDDEDDDLKLVQASAGLIADLEHDLPKILWKTPQSDERRQRVHTRVKERDLDRIVSLIEPFQGEPQLLDAKLKVLLPPIVDAYLAYLQQKPSISPDHISLETAICRLLYTLCKVRGSKIIVGFLNNEPKHLEPVLEALECTLDQADGQEVQWQVPYVLLLWLSHLLLTPFDLSSISAKPPPAQGSTNILPGLPPLITRILQTGLAYIESPTNAQAAAAAMLVRLSIRPDVHKLGLADKLVLTRLPNLQESASGSRNVYEKLGSLRLIAGVVSSAELNHLIPSIYQTCVAAFDQNDSSSLSSNAVAKKLVLKIFRNIAIKSLHAMAEDGPLSVFYQSTDVLESVIDYLLRSLSDKDTPVRYAAAKGISLIVLELEPSLGHEVIQAILEMFKDDMPRSAVKMDFSTADPLKWHGLTLTLSHTLFKRSASPEQLPDILSALISALQFQQRTATGSNIGSNVRDAANFGIWSLARRYTTAELLPVDVQSLNASIRISSDTTIIQLVAIQLMLSACLDPEGNIRRGSSAALQELIGRHPNQVHEGITLVQVVDYQAVSLRKRAMIKVANDAAGLGTLYWQALLDGLFKWRGLGSADVSSRENAANSIARLAASSATASGDILTRITSAIHTCPPQEMESLHGLVLSTALVLRNFNSRAPEHASISRSGVSALLKSLGSLQAASKNFSPRALRSELPSSLAQLITALCDTLISANDQNVAWETREAIPFDVVDEMVDALLYRREDWILQVLPDLVKSFLRLKRLLDMPLTCLEVKTLSEKVSTDGSKSTLHSVGRAIALGTLLPLYDATGPNSESVANGVETLRRLVQAMNVDWRIIGVRALQLVVNGLSETETVDNRTAKSTCSAVHQGMNDHTIDERGDVGSLVRLQAIACASKILAKQAFESYPDLLQLLKGDIYRLSLEKLDRVRAQAAECRKEHLGLDMDITDVASLSSTKYFKAALSPLAAGDSPDWVLRALLEGCISSGGVSAEPLLQASRQVLSKYLGAVDLAHLKTLMTAYCNIMKQILNDTANTHPALELLAFLLNMQIPQRLSVTSNFRWRNLLSTVQKAHHKSNDIPRILAAIHVYIGLAEIPSIQHEVMKKLISMLKTNPYPRIRAATAEALWLITQNEALKNRDWTKPSTQHGATIEELQRKYVAI